MNKKAFTLIELLAVILILAIILLLAAPLVINIIEDVKKSAVESSAKMITKAAVIEFSSGLNSNVIYYFNGGVQSSNVEGRLLSLNGNIPKTGKVIVTRRGGVFLAIHDGKYCSYSSEEKIVTEKIEEKECLDKIDEPVLPKITVVFGYATVMKSGIFYGAEVKIDFDERSGIDHFYSIDNGKNWIQYTGKFTTVGSRIIAKSVMVSNGLEIEEDVELIPTGDVPSDALTYEVFDGDITTFVSGVTNKIINVDSSAHGKELKMISYTSTAGTSNAVLIIFLDANNVELGRLTNLMGGYKEQTTTIPIGTEKIKYQGFQSVGVTSRLYELIVVNQPKFNLIDGAYMMIHGDMPQSVRIPKQRVQIDYSDMSEEKFYRIGTGVWQVYNGSDIYVNSGEELSARGRDSLGNFTATTTMTINNSSDALDYQAFDGDITTFVSGVTNKIINVDSSAHGKELKMISYTSTAGTSEAVRIIFLDINNVELGRLTNLMGGYKEQTTTIPIGAKKIKYQGFQSVGATSRLYELSIIE